MKKFSFFLILIISAITQVNAQISIDGNNSDWASVPAIATESSGLTTLKVYEDAANLYFYVEGTIGANNDFYIDADNNASTGYTANQAYDFLFQNGTLYQYSGDGSSWTWTNVTTVDVLWQATASFIENKAPKSIINIFNGELRALSVTMDAGWAELSKIPASGAPALYTSPAALSVSPATLSGYTYAEGTGPSSSQSFILSGSNLNGSQVAVSAPANYEISSDNSSFSTSLNVNYSGSTLANTTIYVRLKAGLTAGTYNNELVTCNDNGTASDVSVTNNGTVTGVCPYYVSTTGNDANAGTLASPFKTIQHALNVVSAGCTIYVRAGIYKERLYWVNSGTAGNIITLQNYNGETVNIDGAAGGSNDTEKIMFTLSNKSYITIDGFIIHNNFRAYAEGFYYSGTGTDITIKNCELYDIGWTSNASAVPGSNDNAHAMVFVGTEASSVNFITIENCHIHNCITGYSEAMTMVGNVENFTIINNTVNDITNIGIDLAGYWSWTGAPPNVNFSRNGLVKGNTVYNCISPVATSAGIYTDGAQNITIENNIVYGNGAGIEIGMENNYEVSGMIVRNNLIYSNKEAGLFFGAYANNGLVSNSIFSGNTLYYNDMAHAMGDWTGEIILAKNKDCQIVNNIIYPRDATNKKAIIMPAKTTTNLIINYNLYWRAGGNLAFLHDISTNQNTYSLDASKTEADPVFVSAGTDFHLQSGSNALDKGNPLYSSAVSPHPLATDVDIDVQARVKNSVIDCGTDEYVTEITWTGLDATSPTDWNVANNWNGSTLPTSTDDLIIPTDPASNPDKFPELNSNASNIAEVNNLEIQSSAHLYIPHGKGLTVNGDFVNKGELKLLSSNDNSPSGSFIVLGNNSGSGTVQTDRYLTVNGTWQYVSSPLDNTQSNLFTNATANFNANFFRYNETYDCSPDPGSTDFSNWNNTNLVYAWEYNHNGNGGASVNLVQGKGYAYLHETNLTLSFTGNTSNLNNGSISVPVTFTPNDANSNYFDGWNLVGNSFQAALDWNSSNIDKTHINNTIYYYDGDATPPKYRYFNGSGGTEVGDGSNVVSGGSQYIPAMQGFFVKAVSNGNLVMNNTALVHSSQSLWKNQVASLNFDYFKLEITDGINTDETVIRFNENATNEFDGEYDAYKMFMNSETPYIFSMSNNLPIALNSLESISNNLTIPLSIIIPNAGNYSINLTENNIQSQNVYLKDNFNEPVYINLSETETYNFYSSETEIYNRFEIVFSDAAGIDENLSDYRIYSVRNKVSIKSNTVSPAYTEIYDLSGKLIHKQIMNTVNTEITLNVGQGIYLVKVSDGKNIYFKKVLIYN